MKKARLKYSDKTKNDAATPISNSADVAASAATAFLAKCEKEAAKGGKEVPISNQYLLFCRNNCIAP